MRRRSSSSVPQAGCTSAQRRHCRRSQKPLWPRLPGRPRASGQPSPPCAPPLCRVSASHATATTLRHRLQVLRAVAHVAPWWLYPLCMLALLIPACASAGIHCGRVLAARSLCPCPYPCPVPMAVPMAVPTAVPIEPHSKRALMAPLLPWLAPRPPRPLRAACKHRAACKRAGPRPRRLAPCHTPHATRHTPHATRHTRRRPARRHLQVRRAQPHLALRRGGDLQARHEAGQEALPLSEAPSVTSPSAAAPRRRWCRRAHPAGLYTVYTGLRGLALQIRSILLESGALKPRTRHFSIGKGEHQVACVHVVGKRGGLLYSCVCKVNIFFAKLVY